MKELWSSLVKPIDKLVNTITMYRLLLWGLRLLFAIAWAFSIAGVLPYGPIRPLVSISILIGVCLSANYVLAWLYKVNANSESSNITALLLFFIFQPPKNAHEAFGLALAGTIAVASKYVITHHQRHVFNPAAFGAVVVGLTGILSSRWWIGSDTMFIFVLLLTFLLVRKIHRWPMVGAFVFTAALLAVVRSPLAGPEALKTALLSFPIIFFGSTMLTEPVTTPPRRYQQLAYGVLAGLLFSSGLTIAHHAMSPELSLVIANLLVIYFVPRLRQPLKLQAITEIGQSIRQYEFKPLTPLSFKPGQFIEITLPLTKGDARGNRRSFSIASSPTEDKVLFGVKHYQPSSAFKNELAELSKGTVVTGNNVAGDFLLPIDDRARLVFIAGGIGITPFRSMIKYLVDTKHHRNITLFYAVSDPKQIVYKDVFEEAKDWLKVIYVLSPSPDKPVPKSWKGETGLIDKDMLVKHVLDYKKRQFYVSGPDAMVKANVKLLRSVGVPRDQIKTDYFAGY